MSNSISSSGADLSDNVLFAALAVLVFIIYEGKKSADALAKAGKDAISTAYGDTKSAVSTIANSSVAQSASDLVSGALQAPLSIAEYVSQSIIDENAAAVGRQQVKYGSDTNIAAVSQGLDNSGVTIHGVPSPNDPVSFSNVVNGVFPDMNGGYQTMDVYSGSPSLSNR